MTKVFCNKYSSALQSAIVDFEKENPNLKMINSSLVEDGGGWLTAVCSYVEKEAKEEPTTNQLLEGLIGAVNELTDAVKELTIKKD
jgi:hypothetical protein